MSIDINVPVLINQLPHLQFVAQAEQSRPEVQSRVLQELANEMRKREQSQVQNAEASETTAKVKDDSGGGGGQQAASHRRRKAPEQPEPEPEPQKGVWQGHIVNVKI
jgi:hypothetical protein